MSSTLPPLVQACSGALASATANTVSYPFDLVATKVQTSRSKQQSHGLKAALRILKRVLETRGISGLYSGLETDTGATILSSFFYFYSYSFLRNALIRHRTRRASPNVKVALPSVLEELFMGYIAGVASRLVSTPLTLVTVRLQNEKDKDESDVAEKGKARMIEETEKPNGVVKVMKDLYNEGGITGFWRGFTLTVLLSSNPALTWAFTSLFLRTFQGKTTSTRPPSPLMNFLAGATGNATAISIIYPLILAKTRVSASEKRTTVKRVIQDALDRDGFAGLYQGLVVQVVKGFFTQGVTLLTKDRIETQFVEMYKSLKKRNLTTLT